ncbi:MAG: adenosine-specific kinase [Candidatus Helarchaeota archaeon]|nr:adenosine-specific kinase [Candidatus Helarchaeota archaeon]
MIKMETNVVDIEKEKEDQIIIGQGNFSIYTVDNIFRTLLTTTPGIKCGVAMNEADPKLVRFNGTDDRYGKLAAKNALNIGTSHIFVIIMQNAYPINVLSAIKNVPGVCNIYIATANPTQIIVSKTSLGKSVIGVVDGQAVDKIENDEQRKQRRELVKKIGYILG